MPARCVKLATSVVVQRGFGLAFKASASPRKSLAGWAGDTNAMGAKAANWLTGVMSVRGVNHRHLCNVINCGALDSIGHSLEAEFSEPKLQQLDAEGIAAVLAEVRQLLDDSSLPLDLRLNLKRQLDLMRWWLDHPEVASVQDLFETAGAAILIAKQMAGRESREEATSPEKTASKSIFEKMSWVFERLAKAVGMAPRFMEGADKFITNARHVAEQLQHTPPPP